MTKPLRLTAPLVSVDRRPKELTMEMPPESVDRMILRREAINDRQLYRALHELERRQRARRGEDVEPPKAHV
jgi:hypothetical protein